MQTILAIDWGSKRTGIARADSVARIPEPLSSLKGDKDLVSEIKRIVEDQSVGTVVVGLPRNLSGLETPQSLVVRQFATELEEKLQCPVVLQDETLSTVTVKGLRKRYKDADEDSLAAAVILEDYLNTL